MKLSADQVKKVAKNEFQLKLKGKTAVFIDWANVYGWANRLDKEVNPRRLYRYLKAYKEIHDIRLYYGLDKHPKSKKFLSNAKQIGFNVVSKDVKYIPVSLDSSHFKALAREVKDALKLINNPDIKIVERILQILDRRVLRRKCDFDMEIALDCFEDLGKYDSYIFFSGDGDFATLYKRLIEARKQVIVVYAPGHIGREIWEIQKGLFKVNIQNIGL